MNEIKVNTFFQTKRKKHLSRKKSKLQLYSMIKEEARRYCLETGLHGFQYIARPENTSTERFIWTFLCFGALLIALILSGLSWIHNSEHRTLISTDSMQHPISNYLFPGVAICNLNKISRKKAIYFLNNTLNINVKDEQLKISWLKKISILAQMYFANEDKLDLKTINEVDRILNDNNVTAEEALVEMTPSCMDMLKSCMWKQRNMRCDRLFETTRTPEGTCCTFNNYSLKNRTFEGYMASRYIKYPRKLSSCGNKSGLSVLINVNPKDYLAGEISAHGSKVIIFDPLNYPDWGAQRILIPLESLVYCYINPVKTFATDDVREMSIEKRECVLSKEKELKIFANYSYENCITECRIHILQNICGCMPFYFRNEWMPWTPHVRMCTLSDLRCISNNKMRFTSSVPGYDTYKTKQLDYKWGGELSDCKCIPNCEFQTYTVHSTRGTLSLEETANDNQFYHIDSTATYSSVSIFFKGLNAIRNKRDVTVTWEQIFGIFGGYLGLCLGFSFISVADVFYSFILHLGIEVRRKIQKLKRVELPVSIEANAQTINRTEEGGIDIWFIN